LLRVDLLSRVTVLPALLLSLLAFRANADTPVASSLPKTEIDTITVEAARKREAVRQQVSKFVSGIALRRYDQSLADWQREIPICFLVGGLPREDGEYMLTRLSQIAASVGAPLTSKDCKPNFFVVVTSDPAALLKAWTKRDVRFFDSDQDVGGTEIHKFLHAKIPVRAWYNWELYKDSGVRGTSSSSSPPGRIRFSAVRDLAAVVVLVDAPRARGVSFGQLAAYVAMVGLAEIKIDARVSETPSILQLFSNLEKPAPTGLSKWDEAFLKGLYHTEHLDRSQFADIKTAMVQEIAPLH
jgi:uncharacterized protein (UPF0548 family)